MDIALREKLIACFERLHQNPELSWQETETRAQIAVYLSALEGVEILFNEEAGLLCRITNPKAQSKVLYRADIDALPILEETGLAYASQHPGRMHACGHDGHITTALGVIELLLREPRAIHGDTEFHFIFQAAEEVIPSGARALVESGVLTEHGPYRAIYGMHFIPQLPAGDIALLPEGAATTANGFFTIEVHGHSAHSSQPHLGRNPISIAAQLISALESIPAQKCDPRGYQVLSICQISAGSAPNQIPERLTMAGTLRVLSLSAAEELVAQMENIAAGFAAAHGVEIEVSYRPGHPPVINDGDLRMKVKSFLDASGRYTYIESPFWSPSEDFAYYGHIAPSYFLLLGSAGCSADQAYANHHPKFHLAPEAIIRGAEFWADYLRKEGSLL